MIKVLELFSGYGGASFALKKANIDFECIGYSDIEKCANYIFALNHGNHIPQLGDITKIIPEKLPDFDLLTGGFPCQSFSMAGKREGFDNINKGLLFFEIIRIAKVKNPRYMLLENVEGILNHDNGHTLNVVLNELQKIGYFVRYKLLYSKDFGIPQNRPRVWFVCFKNKNDFYNFLFPENEILKLSIKNLLLDVVDKKYFLNEKQFNKIKNSKYSIYKNSIFEIGKDKILQTLCASTNGECINFEMIDFRIDGKQKNVKNNLLTLTASHMNEVFIKNESSLCRRLTPRECFRIMGFLNDEIDFGNLSDNKLYFLAGNGWDINVASKIFKQMFIGNQNNQKNLIDFIRK